MRLFRGRCATCGLHLTALAAGLVVIGSTLFGPAGILLHVGIGHGSIVATLVGSIVMGAALLDRWKPMRWVAMIGASVAIPLYAGLAITHRPVVLYLAAAATSATIAMVLGSMPVHRWFAQRPNEWGSAPASTGGSAVEEPRLLPAEPVDLSPGPRAPEAARRED